MCMFIYVCIYMNMYICICKGVQAYSCYYKLGVLFAGVLIRALLFRVCIGAPDVWKLLYYPQYYPQPLIDSSSCGLVVYSFAVLGSMHISYSFRDRMGWTFGSLGL